MTSRLRQSLTLFLAVNKSFGVSKTHLPLLNKLFQTDNHHIFQELPEADLNFHEFEMFINGGNSKRASVVVPATTLLMLEHLAQDRRNLIHAIFRAFDEDDDGVLNYPETFKMMKLLGIGLSDKEFEEWYSSTPPLTQEFFELLL